MPRITTTDTAKISSLINFIKLDGTINVAALERKLGIPNTVLSKAVKGAQTLSIKHAECLEAELIKRGYKSE